MTERIMYVCSWCADNEPEMCGRFDRNDLRVMPDGRWLCDGCFDDLDPDEKGATEEDSAQCWNDFPAPPEYGPIALPPQKSTQG